MNAGRIYFSLLILAILILVLAVWHLLAGFFGLDGEQQSKHQTAARHSISGASLSNDTDSSAFQWLDAFNLSKRAPSQSGTRRMGTGPDARDSSSGDGTLGGVYVVSPSGAETRFGIQLPTQSKASDAVGTSPASQTRTGSRPPVADLPARESAPPARTEPGIHPRTTGTGHGVAHTTFGQLDTCPECGRPYDREPCWMELTEPGRDLVARLRRPQCQTNMPTAISFHGATVTQEQLTPEFNMRISFPHSMDSAPARVAVPSPVYGPTYAGGARFAPQTHMANLYPGIDLDTFNMGTRALLRFTVHPGANPSNITIRPEGTPSVTARDGETVSAGVNGAQMRIGIPAIFPGGEMAVAPVPGRYDISGTEARLALRPEQEPEGPVLNKRRTWDGMLTYLGGAGNDTIHAVATEGGLVALAGCTAPPPELKIADQGSAFLALLTATSMQPLCLAHSALHWTRMAARTSAARRAPPIFRRSLLQDSCQAPAGMPSWPSLTAAARACSGPRASAAPATTGPTRSRSTAPPT